MKDAVTVTAVAVAISAGTDLSVVTAMAHCVIGVALSTYFVPKITCGKVRYSLTQFLCLAFIAMITGMAIARFSAPETAPLTGLETIDTVIAWIWQQETDLRALAIGYFLPTIIFLLPTNTRLRQLLHLSQPNKENKP